jgi:hypothetical protein
MSESNTAVLDAPEIVNAGSETNPFPIEVATPKPKKPVPKPKAKPVAAKNEKPVPKGKTPAPKAKANTAPKSKPMPNGKSVHANEPKREPVWNPRRTAVVKAMRQLGCVDNQTGQTASVIAAKAAKMGAPELAGEDGPRLVKVILDVYRTNELIHNGFASSYRDGGERELRYFLTARGKKTEFPQKEAPAKAKE